MAGAVSFSERFKPIRRLGEGGAGEVWLVEDRLQSGRQFALKTLLRAEPERLDELRAEFSLLGSLSHPNLVRVFDFHPAANEAAYFTMEWIDGPDIVQSVGEMGPEKLPGLADEALRALAFLHQFGVIHRDLKPGNVLVRREPRLGRRLALLDFGLAQRRGVPGDREPGLAGTIPYLAPELLENPAPTTRSDLYGLGAVLFEALSGKPPIAAAEPAEMFAQLRSGERASHVPSGDLEARLLEWIESLLAPSGERPGSAAAALASLNGIVGTDFSLDDPVERRSRLQSGEPIGRAGELKELLRQFERRRVLWVTGAAGMGKTRLLSWLRTEAARRGMPVEQARCGEGHGKDQELAAWLGRRFGQAVVLLDDAENAGPLVSAEVDRILTGTAPARFALVIAVDPGSIVNQTLERRLSQAGLAPMSAQIALEPLGHSDLGKLIGRATGSRQVGNVQADWLQEQTEGVPLFAETLLVDRVWESRDRVEVPETLEQAVGARYLAQGPLSRGFLQELALLQGPVTLAQVVDAGRLGPEEALAGSTEAEASGLVRRHDATFELASRVLVDAIGKRMIPAELDGRLPGILRVLEDIPEPERFFREFRVQQIFGNDGAAIEAALPGLDALDPSSEPARLAALLRAVLLLMPGPDPRRADLRGQLGEALMRLGRGRDAARSFGAARYLTQDVREKVRFALRQARACVAAGRVETGCRIGEIARGTARELGDQRLEARAELVLGAAYGRAYKDDAAFESFERAVAGLREDGSSRELAEALHYLGFIESRTAREGADTRLSEARDMYLALGEESAAIQVVIAIGTHWAQVGDQDQAQTAYEQAIERARALDDSASLRYALNQLQLLELNRERFDRARSRCTEIESIALRDGDLSHALRARNIWAEATLNLGGAVEAAADLREAIGAYVTGSDHSRSDLSYATLAECLCRVPEPPGPEIREITRRFLEHTAGSQANTRSRLSALVLEAERCHLLAEDEERIDGLFSEYQALVSEGHEAHALRLTTRMHLVAAGHGIARGRLVEAEYSARAAIKLAEQGDQLGLSALGYGAAARVFAAQGRDSDAAKLLDSAAEHLQRAAERIDDPDLRADFLARPDFRSIRNPDGASVGAADPQVLALYDMVRALNEESDPQKMLESILDKALAVVQAERGMVLLRDEDSKRFHVHLARNLEQETIQDVEAFSASVVERAGGGEAVLAIDAGEDDRFSALKSVHLHGIRSLMCVPLRSRGKIVGAVYVDSRSSGSLFTSDDLEFIEAFADHAALALQNARERQRLEGENRKLREAVTRSALFDNIVGASPAMEEVFLTLGRVSGSDLPVLIHGESGTGKELAARAVHYNSARRDAPFVSESCAAVPSELMESTLFGHRKGAFTGAIADHRGLFQQADGGTLFLDEVGDMPQEMQARLLRVLQEREVRPIGGERAIPVDVRIVTATHRDLLQDVADGGFREDLLYRLRVLVVELPPLRERVGDVPLLVRRFLDQEAASLGRRVPTVSPDVMRLFERYRWPGNVRELQNYVQRLTLLAGPNDVTLPVLRSAPDIWAELSVDADSTDNESRFSLARNEKERIEQALEAAAGNRTRAAKLLGIGRATLYRKMQQYRLE